MTLVLILMLGDLRITFIAAVTITTIIAILFVLPLLLRHPPPNLVHGVETE